MSWRDAPLVKPAGAPAWQSAPLANSEPQSGIFTITPGGMIDQATWDRLQRDKPQVAANLLEEHSADAVARDVTTGQAIRIGAGKSFADLGTGVRQLYNAATENPNAEQYTRQIQSDLNAYQTLVDQRPIATGAGELVGDLAIAAPIPMGGAGILRGMAGAAAGNAALAGAEFVPENGSRLVNTGVGAILGAGGHAAMGLLGKSINAIRGRMRNVEEERIHALAAEHGVPLTAGDATQSPWVQGANAVMERLGVAGNAAIRPEQAKQATRLMSEMVDDHKRYVGIEDPRQIKEALWRRMLQARGVVKKYYDAVEDAAGNRTLLTSNLSKTARDLIARETNNIPVESMQNRPLLDMLGRYTTDAGLTFGGARKLRSRMKSDIRAAEKNMVIGGEDVALANRLVDALEQDISDFGIKSGGKISQLLRAADTAYKENVVPYKDQLLAKMMNDADFDVNLESWLKQPSRMRRIYAASDERGKQAIQFAMLDKAVDMATMNRGLKSEYVSPKRLVDAHDRMRKSFGHTFEGEEKKRLDGVITLMRHIQSVDRSKKGGILTKALAVGTGVSASGGSIAGATSLLGPIGGVAAAGAVPVIRFALGTNKGARLFSAAADMKNDPKALSYLWDSLRLIAERNKSVYDGTTPPGDDD